MFITADAWWSRTRVLVYALVVSSAVACATLPPSAGITAEELRELEAVAAKEPANHEAQAKLVNAYVAIYRASKEAADRERAIRQARVFLKLDSEHPGGRLVLYSLLADRANLEGDISVLAEMSQLYQTTPALMQGDVAPPILYEAITDLRSLPRGASTDGVKNKLKQAIREKPTYVASHRVLAEIYEREGHRELSIAMLLQAVTQKPDDAALHVQLGRTYVDKARSGGCAPQEQSDLNRAVDAYKAATKISPNSAVLHREVALVYELLGAGELYLFEVQRYHELANSGASKLLLADALLQQDRAQEALRLYAELEARYPRYASVAKNHARARFSLGEWEESVRGWKRFRKLVDKPYFYGRLNEGLAIQQLQGTDVLRLWLKDYPRTADLTAWEMKVLDFHLGSMSEEDFLRGAQNLCQKVEAQFYVGFQHWVRGDVRKARASFEDVVRARQGYPHVEYIAAFYALKRMGEK